MSDTDCEQGTSPGDACLWERYAQWYITEETEVFSQDQRELDFYRSIRRETRDPCLEIGAGYGRLAGCLSAASVTAALEPSRAMLAGWTAANASLASRIRGKGQSLPFRNSVFGLVAFPYNGIQCILDREGRRDVLRESHRILLPGGSFALEVCHAFSFRPEESGARRYRTRLDSGRTVQLVESIARCVEDGSITYDMTYSDSDGKSENIVLTLALIEPEDLLEDLSRAGFSAISMSGDYDGSSFSGEDSPRLLVKAVKGKSS